MLPTPFPVILPFTSSLAKWPLPPERRTHHPPDDRDWSWRAPDLSTMMSKLCSYMSTGCSVTRCIQRSKTALNERAACWWPRNRRNSVPHGGGGGGSCAMNGRGRVEARNAACALAHRSRRGTSAELQCLLISPFLIFSSLNAREALINFYFNLLGALSQLTVVLIIVVFGQWEQFFLTCLCCLEVLQKIHKANNGPPTRRIHVEAHTAALLLSHTPYVHAFSSPLHLFGV